MTDLSVYIKLLYIENDIQEAWMKKYDIIVIGMGPAGMAVSAMGSAMGLKVLAVEKHKLGGECLNVGCIPSKALLKAAEANNTAKNLKKYGIELDIFEKSKDPMNIVREKISGINNKKFMKVFEKVDLIINEGNAEFIDSRTISAAGEKIYCKENLYCNRHQSYDSSHSGS